MVQEWNKCSGVWFWIRNVIWEQNVSLFINELGVSSFPEGGLCIWWMRRRLLDTPIRSVSCVDQREVGLDTVAGRQALLQQRGELLRELLPVLFPDLVLKAMQDLGGENRKQWANYIHLAPFKSQFYKGKIKLKWHSRCTKAADCSLNLVLRFYHSTQSGGQGRSFTCKLAYWLSQL